MRAIDIIMSKKFGRGKKGMVIGWPELLKVAGGTATDIVGATPPITLADAIKGKITKLIQYGLCDQDGTPTPSSPVDIMCNNGVLKMVDDELPAGYKRVLGFSLNNNAYWEIEDFPLYGSDTLRFSFDATDACNVIGAYSGSASGNNYSLYVGSSSNYLRYKNGAYNSAVDFNTRYDVEITPTGSSGMKVNSTWTEQSFTTPTNLCIGTTATSASSAKLKGNLYKNIEVVGRAKFIPCERVSDNALGYYDTIGEAFHEQASGFSGAVSLGYDGSHYELRVVGTDEVISITASGADTQTASAPDLFAVGDYADEVEIISGGVRRRIGWHIFDGAETFGKSSAYGAAFYIQSAVSAWGAQKKLVMCSHYLGLATATSTTEVDTCFFNASGHFYFRVADNSDPAAFKTWLAEQYAAGTPVIVLFVLAEETTESVTPQPLNTTAGDNVISVTANVSPIEFDVTYMKGA